MKLLRGRNVAAGFLVCISLGSRPSEAQYTANFQTNVISAVTSNWSGDYIVGNTNYADTLLVENGGVLANNSGYLGNFYYSSNNSVLVTGTGSVWSNSGDLFVGADGSGNRLVISNQGQLINNNCWVGAYGGSNNSVLVTGTGSIWGNRGDLHVGTEGQGNSLIISNGGLVVDYSGVMGDIYGGTNSALVTGTGSVWSNSGGLVVGNNSSGNSLAINNGGKVVSTVGSMGSALSSGNNSVLVTGTGSVWSNSGDLYVGYDNSGNRLLISNQGQLVTSNGWVGVHSGGGNNSVLVTGSGSVWGNIGDLHVGENGGVGNSLVISNGGTVINAHGVVGSTDFSGGSRSNSVLVTGTGSVWSNTGSLTVGYVFGDKANSLVISNGGQVIDSDGYVGSQHVFTENNSTARVNDRAVWQNDRLYVGYVAGGNLLLVDGGTVLATNLVVGAGWYGSLPCDDVIELDSGSLVVTNATHDATLEVRSGKFIFNGGILQVDRLVMTNACGLFVRNGGTLVVGNLVLDPSQSAVGDGIPNGWKQQYGLDPFDPNLASEDTDGDGRNNLQEYLAGTNPTNSASAFRIIEIAPDGDDVFIAWTAVGGKQYALQTTTGYNGSFSNDFVDLNPAIVVLGTGETEVAVLHLGGATNAPARYYRVRLVP